MVIAYGTSENWRWNGSREVIEFMVFDEAGIHAAHRADALLALGDMEGRAVWHRIERAIDELRRTAPGDDETMI